MEPVSVVVTALAAGAAAALKPTAEQVVKDLYEGLKTLIKKKYAQVTATELEKKPDSAAKRASVEEDLQAAGADTDAELLAKARQLIAALRQHDPDTGRAIGVDLEEVEAADLRIGSVDAEGTGVRVRKGRFAGSIDIGDVRAGPGRDEPDP